MKMLLISDGHGAIDNLKAIKNIASEVDAVLFAGDFAAFNKAETGLPFLKELKTIHKNVYSVLGNCDEPSFIEELIKNNINVQASKQHFKEFTIMGSGGASKFTGATPNERTDEDLAKDITNSYEKNECENLIIITHNPPHGVKVDKVAPLIHVGSKLIRKFIENAQPIIAISGHIHEAYGIDAIGKTVIVNPGALCNGRYAIAEITKEKNEYKTKVKLKTI